MEPEMLIIAALAAGVTETGKLAVKDAYESLKSLILKRFADKNVSEGEMVMERHQEKPGTWEEPLKELLVEAEVTKSNEIIEAAQKLMAIAKPQQTQMGKFNIQGQNVTIGNVNQTEKIDTLIQNIGIPKDGDS
jgi:hypothetical protein